jgi:RHS repeat-associated protein
MFSRKASTHSHDRRQRFRTALLETLETRLLMDASAQEQLVNNLIPRLQSSDQQSTALAVNSQGDRVIVYAGYRDDDPDGVFYRQYPHNAPPRDVLLANVERRQEQSTPSVVVGDNGNFAIVWQGRGRDEVAGLRDTFGVFLRWFNSQGQPLSGEVIVNQHIEGVQEHADLALMPDGSLVVVWAGSSREDASGVYARRFSKAGQPLGPQVLLHAPDAVRHDFPSVDVAQDGSIYVTWSRRTGGDSAWDIFVRKLNSQLQPLTDPLLIGASAERPELAGTQVRSRIATLPNGESIITWSAFDPAQQQWNIAAQRLSPAGTLIGDPFRVNRQSGGVQKDPDIAVSSDGRFVISWTRGLWNGSGWEVVASVFDPAGQSIEDELPVHTITLGYASGHQQFSAVVWGQGVNPTFAWSGRGENDRGGVWTSGPELQSRPRILAIPPQTIREEELLSIPLEIIPAYEGQVVQLGLDPNDAPFGATIDPLRKLFLYRPREADGPGVYSVTLLAHDILRPDLPTRLTFEITVLEVNRSPVLVAPTRVSVDEESPLQFQITATDPDIPQQSLTYFIEPNTLQIGMTIDPQLGIIRWWPDESVGPTEIDIVVGVRDSGSPSLTATQTVTIEVREVNRPPQLSPLFDVILEVNESLTNVVARATDPDRPHNVLRYRLVDAPTGMTIDAHSGVIAYQAKTSGVFPVTVEVIDDGTPSLTDRTSFRVLVSQPQDRAPTFSPVPNNQVITEEVAWSYSLPGVPRYLGQSISYRALHALPNGMTLSATGVLTWTPTEQQGPQVLTLAVEVFDTNEPAQATQASFEIQVLEANRPPVWSDPGSQVIDEEVLWSKTFFATDPDWPANSLTYRAVSLPDGAEWDSGTKSVRWQPTEEQGSGVYELVLEVTDTGIPALSRQLTVPITVREVNVAPRLEPISDRVISPGDWLVVSLRATDRDLPANTLTYGLIGNVPSGLTLDANTGRLQWSTQANTPLGIYPITIEVRDSGSPQLTDRATFLIEVAPAWVLLQEGERLSTAYISEHELPAGTEALEISFRQLQFDATDTRIMRDAFELALVDRQDRPLVGITAISRDAFFNISEGGLVSTGPGVIYDLVTGTVTVDVQHLPAGTTFRLIRRLVGNDADQKSRVEIRAAPKYLTNSPVPYGRLSSSGYDYAVPTWGSPVNWSNMGWLPDGIMLEHFNTWFDEDTNRVYSRIEITNTTTVPLSGPILLVAGQLSDPTVSAVDYHGVIPAVSREQATWPASITGSFYWDITAGLANEALQPGASRTLDIAFEAPNRERFLFDPMVLAPINQAPQIVSSPTLRARPNAAYTYQLDAHDLEKDTLTYHLLDAPSNMILDATTGMLTWSTPNLTSSVLVRVEVRDSRGGSSQQSFTLEVSAQAGSPPVITSVPVVDAYVGEPYRYVGMAHDADQDPLVYQRLQGPASMTAVAGADGYTFVWTPTAADIDREHVVTWSVTDNRNGSSEQSFVIVVHPNPRNAPPLFVSTPPTEFKIPRFELSDTVGEVSPRTLEEYLIRDETVTRQLSLQWNAETSPRTADLIFVVDESGSMQEQTWLRDIVSGIDDRLRGIGVYDNRYAIVGYGGDNPEPRSLLADGDAEIMIHSPRGELIYGGWLSTARTSTALFAHEAGEYVVTLRKDALKGPGYSNSPWQLPFDIERTKPASNGNVAGTQRYQGTLGAAGQTIEWNAVAGRPFLIHAYSGVGITGTLVDPSGRRIEVGESLAGWHTLHTPTETGRYRLQLAGAPTTTYDLQVFDVANSGSSIAAGERVAGTFSSSSDVRFYTFDATAAAAWIVDHYRWIDNLTGQARHPDTRFEVISPTGQLVTPTFLQSADLRQRYQGLMSTGDDGVFSLPMSGKYTLVVRPGSEILDYAFQLHDGSQSQSPVQANTAYPLSLLSDGTHRRVEFQAIANHRYQFEATHSGTVGIDILDARGHYVVSGTAGDIWEWTAPVSGTYEVVLSRLESPYFQVPDIGWLIRDLGANSAPPAGGARIAYGQSVSDTIGSIMERDQYVLAANAGDLWQIDVTSASTSQMRMRLKTAAGGIIWDSQLTRVGDISTIGSDSKAIDVEHRLTRIPTSGDYMLEVYSEMSGNYEFVVTNLLQTSISDLTNTWTANIDESYELSSYRFTLTAGEQLKFRDKDWLTPNQASTLARTLKASGEIEDGYDAIVYALENNRFRDLSSRQLVLITDEDRDAVDANLRATGLLQRLQQADVTLHILANSILRKENGDNLLGWAFDGKQYIATAAITQGGFEQAVAQIPVVLDRTGNTKGDYFGLIEQNSGFFWDIMSLRQGTSDVRTSFSAAFVHHLIGDVDRDTQIELTSSQTELVSAIGNPTWSANGVTYPVTFRGDGDAHKFEMQFLTDDAQRVLLGAIPVGMGTAYRYDYLALDPDRDPLRYRLTNSPIDSNLIDRDDFHYHGGTLTWRTKVPGDYAFTLEATDPFGQKDLQTWQVTVRDIGIGNHAPTIMPIATRTIEVDNPIQIQVEADDLDRDGLTYQLQLDPDTGKLPPVGMSIHPESGLITWRPNRSQKGSHPVFVRVVDGHGGKATLRFQLRVIDPAPLFNDGPIFVSAPPTYAIVGERFQYPIDVLDPNGDRLSLQLLIAPERMVLDAESGRLVWQPRESDIGTHSIVIRAEDMWGAVQLHEFSLRTLRANEPPQFHSLPVLRTLTGEAWVYPIDLRDANGDRPILHWGDEESPHGAVLNSDARTLTFTPPSPGLYAFTVVAEDYRGGVTKQQILLEATGRHIAPFFLSTLPTHAVVGEWLETTILVRDRDLDEKLRLRIESDSLLREASLIEKDPPTGSLPGTRAWQMHWRPTGTGLYHAQLVVEDEHGLQAKHNFSLMVYDATTSNQGPMIRSAAPAPAVRDLVWSYSVEALDREGETLSYSLDSASLSRGMTIDSSGTIHWTPSTAGEFRTKVTVHDAGGRATLHEFVLPVLSNAPPRIVSTPERSVVVGTQWKYDVQGIDPNPSDSLAISLVSGPSGMSFASPAKLIWTPSETGSFSVIVAATDSAGATSYQTFDVTSRTLTNGSPSITNAPRQTLQADTLYQWRVEAVDPENDALRYKLLEGPSGLTLSTDGFLRWRPAQSQLTTASAGHRIRVQVIDELGATGESIWNAHVVASAANTSPEYIEPKEIFALADRRLITQLAAIDSEGDTLHWQLLAGPHGLSIDAWTGVLTWEPSAADIGRHAVTMLLSDLNGGTERVPLSLVVRGSNTPPRLQGNPATLHRSDTEYRAHFAGSDIDGDRVTFSLLQAPTIGNPILDPVSGHLTWLPKQNGTYSFTVAATDTFKGRSTLNFQVVVDDRGMNRAPTFASYSLGVAERGTTYSRNVVANDPENDTITYNLVRGPSGMSISSSGKLQWNVPPQHTASEEIIEVKATDVWGAVGAVTLKLPVKSANRAPTFASSPITQITLGQQYVYSVKIQDADNDDLYVQLAQGPNNTRFDSHTNTLYWTTDTLSVGSSSFEVTLTDERVTTPVKQSWNVQVVADTEAPTVSVTLPQNYGDSGQLLAFTATARDNVRVKSLVAEFVGAQIPLSRTGTGYLTLPNPGSYLLRVRATDDAGNETVVEKSITVRNPTDKPPQLRWNTPEAFAVITAPIELNAAVADPENSLREIRVWLLSPSGDFERKLVFEKTTTSSLANSENWSVGTFDPTMLANGEYLLLLEAMDTNFNVASAQRTVRVAGGVKLGTYQMKAIDLIIPIGAASLTISRVYDSQKAEKVGSFGRGWELEIEQSSLTVDSSTLGEIGSGRYAAFKDGTKVTIQVPGGLSETHLFTPIPGTVVAGEVIDWLPSFKAPLNSKVKLIPPPATLLRVGQAYQTLSGTTYSPYDPSIGNYFDLEYEDRTQNRLNATTGELVKILTFDGAEITVADNGLTSSRNKSIVIERDHLNRIVAVHDPKGDVFTYEYDALGRLAATVDRNQNRLPIDERKRTTYQFDEANPWLIKSSVGPDGRTAFVQSFDEAGRLTHSLNAVGQGVINQFDSSKLTMTLGDHLQTRASLQMDNTGRPVTVVGERGNRTELTYNELGLPAYMTSIIVDNANQSVDERNTFSLQFDEYARPTQRTDSAGNATRYYYDVNSGKLTASIDALGNTQKFGYNELGMRIDTENPQKKAVREVTDDLGRVIAKYAVDRSEGAVGLCNTGDVSKSVCYPEELVTENLMGESGLLVQQLDESQITNYFEYNTNNRVSKQWFETQENGETIQNVRELIYDANDIVIRELQYQLLPDGTKRYETSSRNLHDEAGRPLIQINHANESIETVYDAAGRPILQSLTDQAGVVHKTYTVYDSLGRVLLQTEAVPEGQDILYAERRHYDSRGKMLRSDRVYRPIVDLVGIAPLQETRLVSYGEVQIGATAIADARDFPNAIVDGDGRVNQRMRTKHGNTVERRTVVYDENRETSISISRTVFDEHGRAIASTDEYRPGQTTGITGTRFFYNAAGEKIRSEYVTGLKISVQLLPDGTYQSILDDPGELIDRDFLQMDDAGRLRKQQSDTGEHSQLRYNPQGRTVEVLQYSPFDRTLQNVTRSYHDAAQRLTITAKPLLSNIDGPADAVFVYTDAQGNTLRTEQRSGVVIAIKAVEHGRYESELKHAGEVVHSQTTVYDSRGQVIRQEDSELGADETIYDEQGNSIATISPLVWDAEMSSYIRIRSEREYTNGHVTMERTGIRQYPDGHLDYSSAIEVRYVHDLSGQLLKTIFADGTFAETIYNEGRLAIAQIDRSGLRTDFEYDKMNRLSAVLQPIIQDTIPYRLRTEVQYDDLGNQTQIRTGIIQYPDGAIDRSHMRVRAEKFDVRNRYIGQSRGGAISERRYYDATGRIKTIDNAQGVRVTYGWDIEDLELNKTVKHFNWSSDAADAEPRETVIEQSYMNVRSTSYAEGTTTILANEKNQEIEKVTPSGRLTYEYDIAGRLIEIVSYQTQSPTLPESKWNYGYDGAGRLSSVSLSMRDGIVLTEPETYRYSYDVYSRIYETEYADGTIMRRQFNPFGSLVGVVYWQGDETPDTLLDNPKLMEFRYQFDLSGNRTSTEELYWDPTDDTLYQRRLLSFQYDAAGRLIAEAKDDNGTRVATYYRYDAASNRIRMEQDLGVDGNIDIVTGYIFDLQDRLQSTTTTIGSESITTRYFYGPDGTGFLNSGYETRENLTDRVLERVEYEYDLMGYLESVDRVSFAATTERTLEEFTNDPKGERLTRRERSWRNGLLTSDDSWLEIYDNQNPTGHSQLLELRRADTGEVDRVMVAGRTLLSEGVQGEEVRSYLADGLGSVRRWGSDWTNAIDQNFDSFGVMEGSPSSAIQPLHGYTGELSISDGELLHLRKRAYDPTMGRFLQPDTFDGLVTDPATLNRYMYAANNPLKFRDPSGNTAVLFDGTWNHDDPDRNKMNGVSLTNVAKLYFKLLQDGNTITHYLRGVGNEVENTSQVSQKLGGAFGLGLKQIVLNGVEKYLNKTDSSPNLVVGFSRGSTAALEFTHELGRRQPEAKIDALALFDTVGSVGFPGNGINFGFNSSLAPNVKTVTHAVAFQEDRLLFPVTSIRGAKGRGEQQVFWGTHGDVGGGYRDTELHSEHVLWWMTRKLRQVISYAPRLGAECTICTEENSHWPHPLSKYIGNFGWSRGREYRPSTEHPMPGTLALAFFYDDMNFSNVGLDRDTALATQADFPTYYLHYTVGVSGAVGAYPWGYHAATVYAIYHYYAFYSSLIHYFVNRVDE